MNSDVSMFRTISMRGRMAYALMCLEEAILRAAYEPDQWAGLLHQLWKYTSDESLDVWQEKLAEVMPSVVLNCENYAEGGFEHLTEEGFLALRRQYELAPPLLGQLIDLTYDIGSLEMFGGIENGAPESLRNLEAVLLLLKEHSIDPPPVGTLSDKSFALCHGWGEVFESGPLRRI